jgi:hypothetical protein
MSVVINGLMPRSFSALLLFPLLFAIASLTGCTGVQLVDEPMPTEWTVPDPNSAIAQAVARSARVQRIHSVYGLCDQDAGCVMPRSQGSALVKRRLIELDDGVSVRVVVEGHVPEVAENGSAMPIDPAAALPQLYGEVSGLDLFYGGTLWAGRRPAVAHMPSTGDQPGGIPAMSAGLERMHLVGPLHLSYTFAEAADTALGTVPAYHHFRLVDIPANPGGTLQFGWTQIGAASDSVTDATPRGWWLSAMHRQENTRAVTNRFAIQRGGGGLPGPLQDWQVAAALERWHVADTLQWKLSEHVSGTLGAAMQVDRAGDDAARWVSLTARPVFILDRAFQVAVQLAHDRLAADQTAATRSALTVAPSWILGKTEGEGSIHAYYSYARLSDPLNPVNFSALSGDAMINAPGSSFGVRLQRQW